MAGDVGWEWENEFPVDVLMVLRTEKWRVLIWETLCLHTCEIMWPVRGLGLSSQSTLTYNSRLMRFVPHKSQLEVVKISFRLNLPLVDCFVHLLANMVEIKRKPFCTCQNKVRTSAIC
jgi:hypothetical protein